MAARATTHVTIFSKQGCHLCDVVLRMARRIQDDAPFHLDHVDVAENEQLLTQYGSRVPVVLIDQQERFAGKVMERELRQAIKNARWRRPISRILSRFRPL